MFKGEYKPGTRFAHVDKAAANGHDYLNNGQKSYLFSHGTTPARPTGEKEYHSFDPATGRARSSAIEQKLRETQPTWSTYKKKVFP